MGMGIGDELETTHCRGLPVNGEWRAARRCCGASPSRMLDPQHKVKELHSRGGLLLPFVCRLAPKIPRDQAWD